MKAQRAFRRFPVTCVALGIALVVLLLGMRWDINVFNIPGLSLIGIENNEEGEVAIAFLFVIPAFFVDRVLARQRAHEGQLQAEQLRVLRMTMRTVQDIVGNALMSLYLFRAEAEPSVSPESLELFDQIVSDTAAKLKAIGDLEHVTAAPMAVGMGIDYQSTPSTGKS